MSNYVSKIDDKEYMENYRNSVMQFAIIAARKQLIERNIVKNDFDFK
jgi:hypothetical protein